MKGWIITDIILCVLNTIFAILNYKYGNYFAACFNSLAAGVSFTAALWMIKEEYCD